MRLNREIKMFKITSGIFIMFIALATGTQASKCIVGIYPEKGSNMMRDCRNAGDALTPGKCIDMAKEKLAERGEGRNRFELFFNDYNGDLKRSCKQWKDWCPNTASNLPNLPDCSSRIPGDKP